MLFTIKDYIVKHKEVTFVELKMVFGLDKEILRNILNKFIYSGKLIRKDIFNNGDTSSSCHDNDSNDNIDNTDEMNNNKRIGCKTCAVGCKKLNDIQISYKYVWRHINKAL